MRITLEDNSIALWAKAAPDSQFTPSLEEKLRKLSGIKLSELSKNFLIFPSDAVEQELDDKEFVFLLDTKDANNPCFRTGNVMGFIGFDDETHMQIISRFDTPKQGDALKKPCNYFLTYMLQKVVNFAVSQNTTLSDCTDFFDLLPYLFPHYLSKACEQGIFRSYVNREYNDCNVRGPIDIPRHIRYNIPFNGKMAYRTREYVADNNVTQLVRHTIEFIQSSVNGGKILGSYSGIDDDIRMICDATPSYSRGLRTKVISKNLRPITHPYYTAYEPLRKLCLAILQHQMVNIGENTEDLVNGILFDGASLWEEYVGKLLEQHFGSKVLHPNNRTREFCQRIYKREDSGRLYDEVFPDFLFETTMEEYGVKTARAVLDAKYKTLAVSKEDGKPVRNIDGKDLSQMLVYMVRFNSKQSLLLHPVKAEKTEECKDLKYQLLGENQYTVQNVPFLVPGYDSSDSFGAFQKKMTEAEDRFIDELKKCIVG